MTESSVGPSGNGNLRRGALLVFALAAPGLADAYVGPGAGLSLLTALWGLVAAVAVAVGFILMWPIRRMLRRRRNAGQGPAATTPPVVETIEPAAAQVHQEDELETLAREMPAAHPPVASSQRPAARH